MLRILYYVGFEVGCGSLDGSLRDIKRFADLEGICLCCPLPNGYEERDFFVAYRKHGFTARFLKGFRL